MAAEDEDADEWARSTPTTRSTAGAGLIERKAANMMCDGPSPKHDDKKKTQVVLPNRAKAQRQVSQVRAKERSPTDDNAQGSVS